MPIELNAHNAKSIAKRVMKAKDMQIREGFPQVKSTYTLSTPSDRYVINLMEDKYTATHEVLVGKDWKSIAVNKLEGAREFVEDKCMMFIETLTKSNYV